MLFLRIGVMHKIEVKNHPLTRRQTCAWLAGAAALVVISIFAGIEDWQTTRFTSSQLSSLNGSMHTVLSQLSSLNGSMQTLSSNLLIVVKTSEERIPTQAQGVAAIRKQTLALAFNMLSFVADAEKTLPPYPPHLPPDQSGEFESLRLSAQRAEALKFVAQNRTQIEGVLQSLKANGVHLNQDEHVFTEPLTFNEMRVAASELAVAANRLPAQ